MSVAEPPTSPDPAPAVNPIAVEVSLFVHSLDALRSSFPAQLLTTAAVMIASGAALDNFLNKCGERTDDGQAGNRNYKIGPEHFLEFNRLSARLSKAQAAGVVIPQTFILALVSQYDSFIGGLLRCLYRAQPALLMGSEKHLTYAELCGFSDLEKAKEHILEKEIETVLRTSHADQFSAMENRFKIKLREGLAIWPTFIELTERCNLFAHCNGKVSAQYLAVCEQHHVPFDAKPSVGDVLGVSADYLVRSFASLFVVGTKLAHVLWRKVLPDQRKAADESLLTLGYDLLVAKQYDLAVTMGVFSLETLKTHSNEGIRRRMAINLAQAYLWAKNPQAAAKVIDNLDWSSCGPEFQMAVSVLRGDFERAAGLMKVVTAANLMQKNDYREWPLFNEFRKSQVFVETYQSIYGHQIVPVEAHPADQLLNPLANLLATQVARASEILELPATDPAECAPPGGGI